MKHLRDDGYEADDDPDRLQLDVVHGFLRTAYWSPGVEREVVESAVAATDSPTSMTPAAS